MTKEEDTKKKDDFVVVDVDVTTEELCKDLVELKVTRSDEECKEIAEYEMNEIFKHQLTLEKPPTGAVHWAIYYPDERCIPHAKNALRGKKGFSYKLHEKATMQVFYKWPRNERYHPRGNRPGRG